MPSETPASSFRPDLPPGELKLAFVHDFGEAYKRFGLPQLMGRIVGLMLYVDDLVSLDEIAEQLRVSKGPVSQIMRRLRDHNLVEKVWVPGDRKDYYQTVPDIFALAFGNHMSLMRHNLQIARKYAGVVAVRGEELPDSFIRRAEEMDRFYTLMLEHYAAFLAEWQREREQGS